MKAIKTIITVKPGQYVVIKTRKPNHRNRHNKMNRLSRERIARAADAQSNLKHWEFLQEEKLAEEMSVNLPKRA